MTRTHLINPPHPHPLPRGERTREAVAEATGGDEVSRSFFRIIFQTALVILFVSTSFLYAVPAVVDTIRLSENTTLDHPVPIIANPDDGSVFVGGYHSNNVIRYDPAARKILGEIKGINAPLDFKIAGGKLYIYGYNESWHTKIFIYNPVSLTKISEISTSYGPILSFDVDSSSGMLYYGTWGKVYRVKLTDLSQELIVDLGKPAYTYAISSLDVDAERNRLYLVGYDYGGGTASADVINVNLQTKQVSATIPIGPNPTSYDFRYDAARDGENLFVTQMYTSSITVVNVVSNTVVKNIANVSWPQRLTLDSSKHRLYVVDNYTDKFHVIDTLTMEPVKSFSPGDDPSGVCIDAARNRIYTANVWTQDIAVIDSVQESFIESISFAPATPLDIHVDETSGLTYVTNGPNSGLFILDTETGKLTDKVNPYSYEDGGGFTFASGILHIFTGELEVTSSSGSSDRFGYTLDEFSHGIAMFNLTQKKYEKLISPDGTATGLAANEGKIYFPYVNNSNLYLGIYGGSGILSTLIGPSEGAQGIAVNSKTKKCYIADYSNHQLVVFDLQNNSLVKRMDVGNYPAGVDVDAESNLIYVSNYGSDTVSVIDGASDTVSKTVSVGSKPWGLKVNASTKRVYVINTEDNTCSVINARKNSVEATLPVGNGAKFCGLNLSKDRVYVPAQSSGTITVIEDVVDVTPPSVQCPSDISVETTDAGGAVVSFTNPSATDDTDPSPVITVSSASGAKFPAGVTTVKVRAEDATGNVSQCSFSITVNLKECPKPVGELAAVSLAGRKIELSWTLSPTSDMASYKIYCGTSALNYAAPTAVVSAQSTGWTAENLIAGLNYKFVVRAFHSSGCEEQNTNIVSATAFDTPTCLSAKIKSPHNGRKISGERLTVVAEPVCENSTPVKSIKFEYKTVSGNDGDWKLIPAANSEHPNPDESSPFFVHWNVSSLSDGYYQIRAVALDGDKNPDSAPSFTTIQVDHSDPDSSETVKGNGKAEKVEKIENHKTNTVIISDKKLLVPAQVVIPAGALSQQETKVTIKLNPESATQEDHNLKSAGTKIEVTLQNSQSQLSNEAVLTLPYSDDNNDGTIDGTDISENDIAVYYHNPVKSKWEKMAGSSIDKSKNTVTAKTNHFSLFGLFSGKNSSSAPAASADPAYRLGDLYVFPNPAAGGKNPTVHIEAGLSDRVNLKFYDLSGELVHEQLLESNQIQIVNDKYAYEYVWDVSGIASGVYVVSVRVQKQGEADLKAILKAAVVK